MRKTIRLLGKLEKITLIELKIRCAIKGVDLQLQFEGDIDPAKINIDTYKDEFLQHMQDLNNQIPDSHLQLNLNKLLDQFVGLTNANDRFEWIRRFLSTPLSNLPAAIHLYGHYP